MDKRFINKLMLDIERYLDFMDEARTLDCGAWTWEYAGQLEKVANANAVAIQNSVRGRIGRCLSDEEI